MDLLANLALGLSVAVSPENLMYCFIGVLLGTFIGVLPGVGPMATIAMLLPITYYLSPTASIIMLAGIYYGSQYGGSTTAILVNLPGEVSSSVTAIDGYQMAKQGRAGTALAIAALGSFVAGTIATFFIAIFATPLSFVALSFGSPDYFSLIVLGFIISIALANGSVVKALAMIVTGVLFSKVGTDLATGVYRYTYNILQLSDGLSIVAVALGIFGVVEVLKNLETLHEDVPVMAKITSLWPSRDDIKKSLGPILRGTALGSVLGILPGGGTVLSSFSSYALEKRISKHPEEFGHGAIAGVAGPESANNAGAQTSFIPMLALGLPSTGLMALMMGALMIQGITPGPLVMIEQPNLFWGLIASMWIGNAMLVILNLPLVGLWVSLLRIPYNSLFPMIIVFSAVGVFTVQNEPFDVYVLAVFGLIGYALAKMECEPAPLLLGFVLGDKLEENFRRSLSFSEGDPMTFIQHPISAGLLFLGVIVLVLVALPLIRKKRDEVFVEED